MLRVGDLTESAAQWDKKREGSDGGHGRRLDHGLPLVVPLDSDAGRLAGGLAVRQSNVRPYAVVVDAEPRQYDRVLLLEAANDFLAVPDGVAVEGLHLVVVRVSGHVDVPDVLGVLVEGVLGRILLLVGMAEVSAPVQYQPPGDLARKLLCCLEYGATSSLPLCPATIFASQNRVSESLISIPAALWGRRSLFMVGRWNSCPFWISEWFSFSTYPSARPQFSDFKKIMPCGI